jgi:hypothetical protein
MTRDEALDVVIAAAERWAENAEVAFLRRVDADDADERCCCFQCAVRAVPFHAFDAMEQLGTGRSFVRRLVFCMPDLCVDAGYLGGNNQIRALPRSASCGTA